MHRTSRRDETRVGPKTWRHIEDAVAAFQAASLASSPQAVGPGLGIHAPLALKKLPNSRGAVANQAHPRLVRSVRTGDMGDRCSETWVTPWDAVAHPDR